MLGSFVPPGTFPPELVTRDLSGKLNSLIGFLAPEKLESVLRRELRDPFTQYGRLFICQHSTIATPFANWIDQIWLNPEQIQITSINDAIKKLKSRGRLWANYSFDFHRRSQLIQDGLPKVKESRLTFTANPQAKSLQNPRSVGSWCLISQNEIIAAPQTSTPQHPLGQIHFHEDKNAPSRAYLKLWETFTCHGLRPKSGETTLDLGSSPGGWTWVLAHLGCKVISIDRAPLNSTIEKFPNVTYFKKDAFSLEPKTIGKVDWIFSDIICYPAKLYELVQRWLESGLATNFVFTIKCQGETDFNTIEKFGQIPDSRLVHLYHNKHELTWILQKS